VAKRSGNFSVAGLALPLRVWLQRFAFVVLLALAFVLMLASKSDSDFTHHVRLSIVDAVTPILTAASQPVAAFDRGVQRVENFFDVYVDNERLRRENANLLGWIDTARRLQLENQSLRVQLTHVPDAQPRFVTARVVADTGGSFFHSVLLNTGRRQSVRPGQPVISAGGLVGRTTEVGERSARVMLLTDINSRIPVLVEQTGERAILAGTNAPRPNLVYLSANSPVSQGDRIVTSGHGGMFPPGLAVGIVAEVSEGGISVEPMIDFARLSEAIVLDFGVGGILPDPARAPPAMPLPAPMAAPAGAPAVNTAAGGPGGAPAGGAAGISRRP
jgi:rod shape-determining protein MreC